MVQADTPVQAATYVAEDGGVVRSKKLTFEYVPSVDQAAQLAAYAIVDGRELPNIVLPGKPHLRGYAVGDCLMVDLPELGLHDAKLVVLKRSTDPSTAIVTLTCRSETDAKHEYALGRSGVAPLTPSISGYDPAIVPAPIPGSWAAQATAINDPVSGEIVHVIRINGTTVDNVYAAQVVVSYRQVIASAGGDTYGPWTDASYGASVTTIDLNLPAGRWQVQIRYVTIEGAENVENTLDLGVITVAGTTVSQASGLTAAATAALLAQIDEEQGDVDGAVADALAKFGDDGQDLTAQAIAQLAQGLFDVRQAIAKLAPGGLPLGAYMQEVYDTGAGSAETLGILAFSVDPVTRAIVLNDSAVSYKDGTTLASYRTVVSTMFGATNATVATNYTALSGVQGSQASLITGLQSSFGALSSTVSNNYTTLSNADSTEAQARLALASTVGGLSSTVQQNFLTLTNADSTEATARLALASNFNGFQASASSQLVTLTSNDASLSAQLTALNSSYGSFSASVNGQLATLTNAGGGYATSISTLMSNYGGLSATVSTTSAAIATLSGQLVGQWSVHIYTDSQSRQLVAGINLIGAGGSGGTYGAFQVLADSAAFIGSDGSVATFTLAGGSMLKVDRLLVGDLTVGTQQIAYGATLQTAYGQNTNSFGGENANLVAIGVNALGGAVQVTATIGGYFSNPSGSDVTFHVAVYRDNTLVGNFPVTVQAAITYTIIKGGGTTQPENPDHVTANTLVSGPWTFAFQDTPSVGGHTYRLGISGASVVLGFLGNFASLSIGAPH